MQANISRHLTNSQILERIRRAPQSDRENDSSEDKVGGARTVAQFGKITEAHLSNEREPPNDIRSTNDVLTLGKRSGGVSKVGNEKDTIKSSMKRCRSGEPSSGMGHFEKRNTMQNYTNSYSLGSQFSENTMKDSTKSYDFRREFPRNTYLEKNISNEDTPVKTTSSDLPTNFQIPQRIRSATQSDTENCENSNDRLMGSRTASLLGRMTETPPSSERELSNDIWCSKKVSNPGKRSGVGGNGGNKRNTIKNFTTSYSLGS